MQITISSLPTFEAMIFKYLSAYLKHQFTANTRHGTHSPFVYKLADEVIYDFSLKKVYTELSDYRKKLLNDPKTASFVNQIIKDRFKKKRVLELIYRIVKFHKPAYILELSANLGIATGYLVKACPTATLITIEENAELGKLTEDSLASLGTTNIKVLVGASTVVFDAAIAKAAQLDLVYLNCGTVNLNYFELALTKLNDNSLVIVEGMYCTIQSKSNWEIIKSYPNVTVTVDLFDIGLVYFRKGQAKEHFKLKF